MNLAQRLQAARGTAGDSVPTPVASHAPPAPAAIPPSAVEPRSVRVPGTSQQSPPYAAGSARKTVVAEVPPARDALAKLKDRAGSILFERLGTRLNDTTLTEDQLHALVSRS